jgi:hypothetical protein
LLIVFLAAIGATSYLFWMSERDAGATRAAARSFDDQARAAIVVTHDLRAAQQAYVASGQGADFWFARTTAIQADLKGRIAAFRSKATTSSSVSAFEDALGVLQDFEQMDGRAREQVRARKMLPASDLVFADGLDLTQKIEAGIEKGRTAELAVFDEELTAINRRQGFSLVAGAAAGLLIVLLLLPVRAPQAEPAGSLASGRLEDRPGMSRVSHLEDEDWSPATTAVKSPEPVAAPPPAPVVETPAPVEITAPEPVTIPTAPAQLVEVPVPSRVDVPEMARLCGDLARITDTRSLPGLLERTATLIDASGIVLWIADPDGRELAPIVTFGYPQHTVTRLGTIGRDAENATAAAFRTCLLQTVDADAVSGGALAAPLVTPAGCVGVMAAEVRGAAERDDVVLAAAGIVAAQLATLVGPPSARALKSDVAG